MTKESDPYGIEEMAARQAKAREMGGADKVARQHDKGLMTVRERVDKLVDPGSFDEMGLLLHSDLPDAADKTPADGKVCGFGTIDGRTVLVTGDDVTVKAGSGGRVWNVVAEEMEDVDTVVSVGHGKRRNPEPPHCVGFERGGAAAQHGLLQKR